MIYTTYHYLVNSPWEYTNWWTVWRRQHLHEGESKPCQVCSRVNCKFKTLPRSL